MSLRATRQYREALGPGSGKVRVARQYVQVLGDANLQDQSAATALALTQSVIAEVVPGASVVRQGKHSLALTQLVASNWEFGRSIVHVLPLTELVGVAVVRSIVADDTLALTHDATGIASKTVTDALALSHVASVDRTKAAFDTLVVTHEARASNPRVGGGDVLSLSQQVVVGFVKQVGAANTLALTHRARSGIEVGVATDILLEAHDSYDPVTGVIVPNYVGLFDAAEVAVVRSTPYLVQSIISLADRALGVVIRVGAIDGEVSDSLGLTQSGVVVQLPFFRAGTPAVHNLLLTQTADVTVVKSLASTLALAQIAAVVVGRAARGVTDSLSLGHAVGFVRVSADVLSRYRPFVGEGLAGAPTPPPASCPQPNATGECRLCYPVSHPTTFVTLRSPEFGNKDRLQMNRISRETRGGTLIVYADPMWPKLETLVLSFKGLSRSQVQDYLTFVNDHLGLEIGFVDWEGFYWKGVILNPDEPTVQDSKQVHTISFEFEAEPATWEP